MGAKSSKSESKKDDTKLVVNVKKGVAAKDPNDVEPKSPLDTVSLTNIVKLSSSTNFILWKLEIGATLMAYGLFKFLDATHPAPSPKITKETTEPNPAYVSWVRQDKLICDYLIGTLDPTIVPVVSRAQTSKEIWDTLSHTYARRNHSQIKGLKAFFKSLTKGPHPITNFMNDVKLCADQLAIFGNPLDPEDVTNKILESLDSTFQGVIDSVHARDEPISFDELHEKLLNSELTTKEGAAAGESKEGKAAKDPNMPKRVEFLKRYKEEDPNTKLIAAFGKAVRSEWDSLSTSAPYRAKAVADQCTNKSYGYGCKHYRRRCKLRAPCCNQIFFCRHCHNDATDALSNPKERHELVRHDVKTVICAVCDTEQQTAHICSHCGVTMGKYFCEICKFYDDDTFKQQFHCDDCGICRVGGRENFFHCKKCGCCYAIVLQDNHTCVENTMKTHCPICCEFLFDSVKNIIAMKCGHTMHTECFSEMISHYQDRCPICSESLR